MCKVYGGVSARTFKGMSILRVCMLCDEAVWYVVLIAIPYVPRPVNGGLLTTSCPGEYYVKHNYGINCRMNHFDIVWTNH